MYKVRVLYKPHKQKPEFLFTFSPKKSLKNIAETSCTML